MVARGSSRGRGAGRQTNNPTGGRGRTGNGPPGPTVSHQEGRTTPIRQATLPPLVETVADDERPPPDPDPNFHPQEDWQQVSRRRNTTPRESRTVVRNDDDRMPLRPPTPHSITSQRAQSTVPQQGHTAGLDFHTRQRSPPGEDDDDESQVTIHFEADHGSSQDSIEADEEQIRLSGEIEDMWNDLENVENLFATGCPDPSANPTAQTSQALTNTSVQQTLRNQQGYFPTTRTGSAQRGRFGVSNPNSPYLLRVPEDNDSAPTPGEECPAAMLNPDAGSDQDHRNAATPSPRVTTGQDINARPNVPPLIATTADAHEDLRRRYDALALPGDDRETNISRSAIDRDFERELHNAIATSLRNLATDMNQDTTRQVNDLSSRVGTAMGNVTSIMRAQERRQSLVMGNINQSMRDLGHTLYTMNQERLETITAGPPPAIPTLPALPAAQALPALPAAPQPTDHNAGHTMQPTHDPIKIKMLHNACYPHRELRTVRTQVNIAQLWAHRNLSYHEVAGLYKVTAAPVDSERLGTTTTRSGYVHDIQDQQGYFDEPEGQGPFHVNVHNRGSKPFVRKPGRLPKDVWDSLSATDQRNWDTLSDAAKALVVSMHNRNPTPPRQAHHSDP
jgi:hypothetical protein